MSTSATNDPWVVFDYEVDMFFTLCDLLSNGNQDFVVLPPHVRNAVVESALLHARQLADILLSRGTRSDDINLNGIVPNWQPTQINELAQAYGNQNQNASPCWTINKMLAHATAQRSASYDYTRLLNEIAPLIDDIVREIRSRSATGSRT